LIRHRERNEAILIIEFRLLHFVRNDEFFICIPRTIYFSEVWNATATGRILLFQTLSHTMKTSISFFILFLISQLSFAQSGEWIELFNGENLEGWKVSENPDSFQVVDGVWSN